MNPADKAKEMMAKIIKNNIEKNKFVIDEPPTGPKPIKVIESVKSEIKAPIENLIEEAKLKNIQGNKVVTYTKLDQIKAILKGGGMDSMSVDKSLIQIKEVLEK